MADFDVSKFLQENEDLQDRPDRIEDDYEPLTQTELSPEEREIHADEIRRLMLPFEPFLTADDITIITMREFCRLRCEKSGAWITPETPELTADWMRQLFRELFIYSGQPFKPDSKEFKGQAPDGSNIHISFPPVSRDEIYLSLQPPVGTLKDRRATSVNQLLGHFKRFLELEGVTEICVNDPGLVFYQKDGKWLTEDVPELTYSTLVSLGVAAARYANNNFDRLHPILSVQLPSGERAQFVMPPACKTGTVSVTIRRPTFGAIPLDAYMKSGFFRHIRPKTDHDPKIDELLQLKSGLMVQGVPLEELAQRRAYFIRRCVELGQNVVICGETGSGKTTFMKALMQAIPTSERIITIEDVPELLYGLTSHKNQVNLFYPSEAKEGDLVTATSLLKSCLRMKPDRILLAELRGGETYDYLNICLSGHGGSITSCHSGSCEAAFEYLTMKVMQSPTGQYLPYDVIKRMLHQAINVIVHMHNSPDIGRHITEIYFDPDWEKHLGGSHAA